MGREFCLKGIMSVADAKRAVDIGCTAIMVSNHGGRQLDGSRRARLTSSPRSSMLSATRIDVICDGGIPPRHPRLEGPFRGREGVFGRKLYLYALAAGGQVGVERALEIPEPKSNAT